MQYTDHQIEEYIEGRMTKDAAYVFERTISSDFELAYRVESYRVIIESIMYAGFKDNILSIEQNFKKKSSQKLPFWKKVAASIMLVIASSWLLDIIFQGNLFSDSANSSTPYVPLNSEEYPIINVDTLIEKSNYEHIKNK